MVVRSFAKRLKKSLVTVYSGIFGTKGSGGLISDSKWENREPAHEQHRRAGSWLESAV